MDKASEAILALKPVTFRYKKELDPDGIPQFGLVAEQVEKVNPDLVVRDADGKINTVRYEAVNAMLLNEFLKEHHKVEEQQATIAQLKSGAEKQAAGTAKLQDSLAQQQKQIEALMVGLQQVSAQVQLGKSAPQRSLTIVDSSSAPYSGPFSCLGCGRQTTFSFIALSFRGQEDDAAGHGNFAAFPVYLRSVAFEQPRDKLRVPVFCFTESCRFQLV
jgi:Chaperone of endosialidase